MKIRVLQAELRAILRGAKTTQGWIELMGSLDRLYWDEACNEYTADEVAQAEAEVLPWVKVELDRSWPAALRVVAHRPLKALGATLSVELSAVSVRHLMKARGYKSNGELTDATPKALPGLCLEGLEFEGLQLWYVAARHVEVMAAFLDAGMAQTLRHVRRRGADVAARAATCDLCDRGACVARAHRRDTRGGVRWR